MTSYDINVAERSSVSRSQVNVRLNVVSEICGHSILLMPVPYYNGVAIRVSCIFSLGFSWLNSTQVARRF